MATLSKTRKGWENEAIAKYLLSLISFVSNPATISDDIGIDFYCTLFRRENVKNDEQLFPTFSFAIQIKSNKDNIDITNKARHFSELELPLFVGIIDNKSKLMEIYSGQLLPLLFSLTGIPLQSKIKLKFIDTFPKYPYYRIRKNILYFPFDKICEISMNSGQNEINKASFILKQECDKILRHISSKLSHEYIFEIQSNPLIVAGPTSSEHFRDNFLKRLSVAFANMKWLLISNSSKFSIDELRFYENVYIESQKIYKNTYPQYVHDAYNKLKQECEKRSSKNENRIQSKKF